MLSVLRKTLSTLGEGKARLRVVRDGTGDILQSDVFLAAATKAVILGFGVGVHKRAAAAAKQGRVDLHCHSTIYEIEDTVCRLLEGVIPPTLEEVHIGTAEVRKVIKSSKLGRIAGCVVTQGVVRRNSRLRVTRDGIVLWQGPIKSLRRFDEDANEVRENFECGIRMNGFSSPEKGDVLEVIEIRKIRHKLGKQEKPNDRGGNRRN